jgi:uncharacterized protein (DUF1800 family)
MDTTQHQRNVQHLFWRAGFGASPAEIQAALSRSRHQVVKDLLHDSRQVESFKIIEAVPHTAFKDNKKEIKSGNGNNREEMREQLKELAQERRETIGNLNDAWVTRMGQGKGALREKMTFFWHNHFACRSKVAPFIQQQNNTLRTHALGKFGDLLMAISKDAAMLQFLNNQQNRKKSPNENFAREVMELFTLGRGNYTENDIKEAARAFTGWGFNLQGEFVFRQIFHDEGLKTIFGKSGYFKGEDVVEMLLSNPKTADYICTKIYRHFVNERVNPKHVASMSKRFFRSDYDIADLLEHTFTEDWFYDPLNIGAQIKSPVELLAGMQRTLSMDFVDKTPVLYTQKVLGQVLFNPPSVAGWVGGKSWIDSSSLLTRMQLPKILFRNETLSVNVKDSGDANEEALKRKNKFEVTMNWESFAQAFEQIPNENLGKTLASFLLQVPINSYLLKNIENQATGKNRIEQIKHLTIALMSLPEYQVC